jgi:hypothetical protein
VGNGRSAVMVTRVPRQVGGWDPSPRDGNEDYKTFFLMVERGNFAVARSHLLGYRQLRGNRSSKPRRMLTTFDQVVVEFPPRYPAYADEFFAGRAAMIAYLLDRAEVNRHWDAALYLVDEAWAKDNGGRCRCYRRRCLSRAGFSCLYHLGRCCTQQDPVRN